MILSKTWLMLSAENIIQRAWRFISRAAYIQVRCSPTTMAWQEAYFNFRNKSENFSFFNLVFWDENYNFFFSVSCFETRVSFFQSWIWDEKKFFLSILGLEVRTRIKIKTILTRVFKHEKFAFFWTNILVEKGVNFSNFLNFLERKSQFPRTRISFCQSHELRREREFENDFSWSSEKKLS